MCMQTYWIYMFHHFWKINTCHVVYSSWGLPKFNDIYPPWMSNKSPGDWWILARHQLPNLCTIMHMPLPARRIPHGVQLWSRESAENQLNCDIYIKWPLIKKLQHLIVGWVNCSKCIISENNTWWIYHSYYICKTGIWWVASNEWITKKWGASPKAAGNDSHHSLKDWKGVWDTADREIFLSESVLYNYVNINNYVYTYIYIFCT